MTNEEAIKMIKDDVRLHHDHLSGKYRKALSMAIEALSNSQNQSDFEFKTTTGTVSATDVIYRQDAIDAVRKVCWNCSNTICHNLINEMSVLPSAEPKTAKSGSLDSEMPEIKADRTTGDLISRQSAIDAFRKRGDEIIPGGILRSTVYEVLENLPSAQRTGEWIMHLDDLFPVESTMECSQCHKHQPITIDNNYCPHCGAKMKGGDLDGND